MANVCVYADGASGTYSGVGGRTKATGLYCLPGLAPGTYKLGCYPVGQVAPTRYWYRLVEEDDAQ